MKHSWVSAAETTLALRDYLRTHATFFHVELWDIALPGLGYPTPLTLRWCDQPFDVPFYKPPAEGGGAAIYAGGTHLDADGSIDPSPKIQRGRRKESIGVEVDELDVDIFLDGTEYLPAADGGPSTPRFTLIEALLSGLFDGAVLTVRRLIMPLPPVWPIEPTSIANRGDLGPGDTSLGAVTLFGGLITESTVSRTKATFTVKSTLEKLNVGMPRNIFQTGCRNDLGDLMCKVDIENGSWAGRPFKASGAISSYLVPDINHPRARLLITTTYPTDTAVPGSAFYFEYGTLQFTSGKFAGLRCTLERPASYGLWPVFVTEVSLVAALPHAPAPGDTVVLRAGCNKVLINADNTLGDCLGKFGNYVDRGALDGAINASVLTITIDDTTGYADPADLSAGKAWILIDTEAIEYTGLTATQFTGCTRGALTTSASSHADGALVYQAEHMVFSGTDYGIVRINGSRFNGEIRVPPPDSVT